MHDNSHAEILVVDDDAMSRRVLAQLLSAAGYNCRVCNDGSEALDAIQDRPPSVLLLDFDMPGPNGAEVLRRLRSDKDPTVAQIPAIMLTAHGSQQSEVSCLQAGADDFVTKPVNSGFCARESKPSFGSGSCDDNWSGKTMNWRNGAAIWSAIWQPRV